MKLSTRSLYGMRALVELALLSGRGPASATHIANRQALSVPYLEQLLHRLRKSGLLTSVRGPRGGYALARHPSQITMAEVVRVLDGEQSSWESLARPMRKTAAHGTASSGRHAQQISVAVGRCVHARLAESLGAVTLEDLCQEAKSLDGEPLDHRYVFHI